jgi:glycosyltransferase involved in cell wall biosynthesis
MQTSFPNVSIIMAVYNTEFVLVRRAIESVINQDFQDFELLVVNDGSKKELTDELEEYVKQFPKIKYFYHDNRGFPKTLNRGIELATGEFIGFCDSDDEYKPNHISVCLAQMEAYDLICSITETIVDTEDDYYVPDRFDENKNIHVDDCVITGTLFGRSTVFKELLFKDIYSQDYDLYQRAAKNYRVEKLNLRTYIYYRNNQDSICSQLKKKKIERG